VKDFAARKPDPEISACLVAGERFFSWFQASRPDGSVLCVRRTDRGLCLNDRAPAAPVRLKQCEPQTALYCRSGRSLLRGATPSGVVAYLGLSKAAAAVGTGVNRWPASTWKVADDVGPAVKLMIGGLLLVGLFGLGRITAIRSRARYAASIATGVIAVAATIALVPSSLSRGFAAALTGTRFSPSTTPIYLLGGVLAGLSFVFSADRCARGSGRRGSSPPPTK
jgi:hypothetical protein